MDGNMKKKFIYLFNPIGIVSCLVPHNLQMGQTFQEEIHQTMLHQLHQPQRKWQNKLFLDFETQMLVTLLKFRRKDLHIEVDKLVYKLL